MDPRVAIVTGGTGGMGPVIGLELVRRGVGRIVFAQRGEATAAVEAVRAAGGRADSLHLDLSSRAGVLAFFDAFTTTIGVRLDILVNNSGDCPRSSIEAVDEDSMTQTIAINVTGPFWMSQAARPLMWESGGGSIVNIGSLAGEDGAAAASIAYSIAKAGLKGMMFQLAKNGFPPAASEPGAGPRHTYPCIRVNNVAPGPVATPMLAAMSATALASMTASTLTDRITTTQEVAAAVAYLCLDATNVTGQTLQLSGGAIRR